MSAWASGACQDFVVIIHHIEPPPYALEKAAERFGANIIVIEPFGEGPARYCNKLQSHDHVIATGRSGAILTDVDLFYLQSPLPCLDASWIQSKIVDHPNPASTALTELFDKMGLPPQHLNSIPTFRPQSHTHMFNCNGGLYALPMTQLAKLTMYWRHYSSKCLTQTDILENKLHHSDQLGFMLALIKTKLPFRHLDLSYNFPTHFKSSVYDSCNTDDIKILHYHHKINEKGRLLSTGHKAVDTYINKANTILAEYDSLPEYADIQAQYSLSL